MVKFVFFPPRFLSETSCIRTSHHRDNSSQYLANICPLARRLGEKKKRHADCRGEEKGAHLGGVAQATMYVIQTMETEQASELIADASGYYSSGGYTLR